jgi:hypothetical protein
MNFAGFIEKISLKTNSSKEIEALYPAIVAAEVQKLPSSQRKFWMMCLNGFAAGPKATYTAANIASNLVTPFTHLWDPFAEAFHYKSGDATVRLIENQQNLFVDFLIPLPFSVMHQLKDNFQTRFVENLSLDVTFRSDAGFFRTPAGATSGAAGFQASLVCIYHNFHDVIENSIRDQNYKRGFPASVYSHFAIPETNVTVAGKIRSCLLSSQNIISEIHCILKRKDGGTANYLSYSPPPVQGLPGSLAANPVARASGQVGPFKFTIKASGRVIWEAYSWELEGPDVEIDHTNSAGILTVFQILGEEFFRATFFLRLFSLKS